MDSSLFFESLQFLATPKLPHDLLPDILKFSGKSIQDFPRKCP